MIWPNERLGSERGDDGKEAKESWLRRSGSIAKSITFKCKRTEMDRGELKDPALEVEGFPD